MVKLQEHQSRPQISRINQPTSLARYISCIYAVGSHLYATHVYSLNPLVNMSLKNPAETSSFKDHFSHDSSSYSKHRPGYPDSLFSYLSLISRQHQKAWDCATGSGQSAMQLAKYFQTVIATDASESQIKKAYRQENIHYTVAAAESSAIKNSSLDLITVAQALHWFDIPAFTTEIERTLKPGGILAAWSYNLLKVNPDVDEYITYLYGKLLAQYWPAERKIVENAYKSINFPFEELAAPEFNMTIQWTFEQIIKYISTWSAVNAYIKTNDQNPVDVIYGDLLNAWGDIDQKKLVTWPLTVRVWQKP